MEQIIVPKGRTKELPVSLGYDASADTFTSDIRVEKHQNASHIASWDCGFLTDGADGELILTLDDAVTSAITQGKGYMDIKRTLGGSGEPVPVFDGYLEVLFKDVVTP